MQRQGHQVAMTGDGVNDLLALREADCSIAVADGSDASRQIAQVVLLDSDFTNLPHVVMEGRKVINNVTRTAQVFFIKTIYSVLVSFFCLFSNQPFPFIPIQVTLIDACIEAYPSFVSIVESDIRRIRGRFLPTALSHAAPFGITVAVMISVFSLLAPFGVEQRQTTMYMLLILISMGAVIKSCIPLTWLRAFVCVTMVGGTFFALAILPSLFEITDYDSDGNRGSDWCGSLSCGDFDSGTGAKDDGKNKSGMCVNLKGEKKEKTDGNYKSSLIWNCGGNHGMASDQQYRTYDPSG